MSAIRLSDSPRFASLESCDSGCTSATWLRSSSSTSRPPTPVSVDLDVGKQRLGRQFRRVAAQQRHRHQAPRDHRVDRHRPLDPLPRPMRQVLHLAARLQHPVPVLDAPPQPVPFQHLLRVLPGLHRQRREQEPLQPLGPLRLRRLAHVHQVQPRRRGGLVRVRQLHRLPAQLHLRLARRADSRPT